MKYVSFSVWGKERRYLVGIVKNAARMAKIYPGWRMIVYHTIEDRDVLDMLRRRNVILKECYGMEWCSPYAWRFLANELPDMERYIVRDADSRISEREAEAVQAWEDSGKPFHIIRDHPNHGLYPIHAGMWGSMKGFINEMDYLLKMFRWPNKGYLFDQEFLKAVIWPKAKFVALQHDGGSRVKYANSTPLPERKGRRFIGERFDEHDVPNAEDQKALG